MKKGKFPNIGSLGGLYSKASSLEDDFLRFEFGGGGAGGAFAGTLRCYSKSILKEFSKV